MGRWSNAMSQGIKVGSDGPVASSVTIENPEQLKTQKVGDNGSVYLGKEYGGEEVLIAFRVEDEDGVSEPEDTEN
jgi:hypothetical protein